MKRIPAIRAKIGDWVYYIGALSFGEITSCVKKIDNELHKSEGLSDAIQRSITDNYKNIKDYILNQEERFFNSLVLAIYDGDPEWIEVELAFEDAEYFNIGFLKLNGEEKIFPVDGQHRVEGIKSAVTENQNLLKEKIPVIFIGHQNNAEGMQRTRRLFSTLNRYAKPVSMSDIVALDEDDSAAIITRFLVENFDLFMGDKIVASQQKAIPDHNKKCITSLITLYECNLELTKFFFIEKLKNTSAYKEVSWNDFKKFRPNNLILEELIRFVESYWGSFIRTIEDIDIFLTSDKKDSALEFRNNDNGGNILFRPVGLVPFVQATLKEAKIYHLTDSVKINDLNFFDEVLAPFADIDFVLAGVPWKNVVWDPINKIMKTGISKKLIKLLFFYSANLQNQENITSTETIFMKKNYASAIGYDKDIESITLDELMTS
jgi:DNA sulfur modification protein DndB